MDITPELLPATIRILNQQIEGLDRPNGQHQDGQRDLCIRMLLILQTLEEMTPDDTAGIKYQRDTLATAEATLKYLIDRRDAMQNALNAAAAEQQASIDRILKQHGQTNHSK